MPPATQRVTRRAKPEKEHPVHVGGIREWVTQFLTVKREVSVLSDRESDLKKRCMKEVEQNGYTDDTTGSQFLDFEEPVEAGGVVCTGLKRERRVGTSLDEESAERFLRSKGLYEECTETIVQVSEDKVLQALYNGKITQADVENHIFKQKVTWAFKPLTG